MYSIECYDEDTHYTGHNKGFTMVPGNIPDYTTHVSLSNNNIRILHTNSFFRLGSCLVLNLNYNKISEVEEGAFNGMQKLEQLYLSHNLLRKLTTESFDGAYSLKLLTLNDNEITMLYPAAFQLLPSSLELDLRENPLECGKELCWLEAEVHKGSISWYKGAPPSCAQRHLSWEEFLSTHCILGQRSKP